MKTYPCVECGNDFKKNQLDPDFFKDGEYYCESCADSLAEAGWDSVDPDHNFESFEDWDENGH
ncbi:hypothetical protein AB6888_00400 [Carnobacterium maltaromaticum]|uniref:hypothetical protein n=1 Tax=Carnobacterium maltaromaticum TaxID=2751 RepID=UPI0039BE3224